MKQREDCKGNLRKKQKKRKKKRRRCGRCFDHICPIDQEAWRSVISETALLLWVVAEFEGSEEKEVAAKGIA